MLRELVPAATRVAVFVNPTQAAPTESTLRSVEAAARAMGLQIQVLNASSSREIDAAFATFARERPDALFLGVDPFLNSRRAQLVNLAARYAIPATFSNRDFAETRRQCRLHSSSARRFQQSRGWKMSTRFGSSEFTLAVSSRAPSPPTCR